MPTHLRGSLTSVPMAGPACYLICLALLGPAFSPLVGIWGEAANVGGVLWRFGVYGQLASVQFYLFAALAISGLVAASLGHRKTLLALGAAAAVVTLLLAVGLPLFVLDFLQIKRSMSPVAFGPFRTAGSKVLAMGAIGIPILAFIALYLARSGKALGPSRRPRSAPVMTGQK